MPLGPQLSFPRVNLHCPCISSLISRMLRFTSFVYRAREFPSSAEERGRFELGQTVGLPCALARMISLS